MNYLRKIMISAFMVLFMGGMIANAQTPQLCTENNFTEGIVRLDLGFTDVNTGNGAADFVQNAAYTAALLGTVELVNGNVNAGLDWFTPIDYEDSDVVQNGETNVYGTSLVGWWTRNEGKNTIIEVTNTARDTTDDDAANPVNPLHGATFVHVEILNENCVELVNFCDFYTPADTHIYDFSNLVANTGQQIDLINTGEGIITITASDSTCNAFQNVHPAREFNYLQGNMQISTDSFQYGANMRARRADTSVGDRGLIVNPGVFNPMEAQYDLYDGSLDGSYDRVEVFARDFNAGDGAVASDVVLMAFADTYDTDSPPNYQVGRPANDTFFDASAVDFAEGPVSCTGLPACFARVALSPAFPGTDETPIDPEEDCDTAGDEDDNGAADCADSACVGLTGPNGETCESPETSCDDAADNDGDGATDLADTDCDDAPGAEGTGEGECTDELDNDGDGNVDCADGGCAADPACETPGDGDGDGDGDGGGSGCSVVSSASAGTSAVNFLLPMMVFGLGIMLRRMRRK